MTSEASIPELEYQSRMTRAENNRAKLETSDRTFSALRAVVFLVICGFAYLSFSIEVFPWPWLIVPSVVFMCCVFIHNGVILKLGKERKKVEYYRKCLLRIKGQWQTIANTGERYRDVDHPYSSDLDIFGHESLFQLLCLARTRTGENTLAAWLQNSASKEEVELRQQAIEELRSQIDGREVFGLLDDNPLPDQVDENGLLCWAEKPFPTVSYVARITACIASGITIAAFFLYSFSIIGASSLMLAVLPQLVVLKSFKLDVKSIEKEVDQVSQRLKMLILVLQRVETQSFQSSKLKNISTALYTENLPPSKQVARLDKLMQYLMNSRRNQFFIPVAMLLCLPVHLIHSISRWHTKVGSHIPQWILAIGEYEALSSLAGYAFENPDDPFPRLSLSKKYFAAKKIGHPLIAKTDCVLNDFDMVEPMSLVMISGSNMSGKSTLLRIIGINTVLAMSGSVVRAASLELSPFSPATCMRINDSLQSNTSYFYAVISRIKQVLEIVDNSPQVFFLLDEILSGTNSHDRRVGAERVISHLIKKGAIGLVTTHDLALTDIVEKLPGRARNIHFEDQLVDGLMNFDYKIRNGIVEKSNALALMKMIGIDEISL